MDPDQFLFCLFLDVCFFSFCFFIKSPIHSLCSLTFNLNSWRRLKNTCKCDRSEDGEDEDQPVKQPTDDDDEKKLEKEVGAEPLAVEGQDENSLTRTPCHDSGIDIRDSLPTVPIIPTKKVREMD